VSEETPDTPETPDAPAPGAGDRPTDPTPDPTKRRPKDSEFFELPPDLKKLPPGGLPATVSSGPMTPKDGTPGAKGEKKGGCSGLILFAIGSAFAAVASLLFVLSL
jgi:hypothetical protein